MQKTILHTIVLILSLTMCAATPALAQKKGSKAKTTKPAKPAEPKEDMSRWTDNPICKVTILDSMVVDRKNMFEYLQFPLYMGTMKADKTTGDIVYENEIGDSRIITPAQAHDNAIIYRKTLLGGSWSEAEEVKVNGDVRKITYPYPMPDGQTVYFAAKSDDDNEGKTFSLYTTTYDSETNTYLEPQRLPFPFNSDADDLFYAEDEQTKLAWLVTTRRQSEGNVCIYLMKTSTPWEYYNAEEMEPKKLKSLALIEHIRDTWASEKSRSAALAEAKAVIAEYSQDKGNAADKIFFAVNSNTVYTSLSDFRSAEARSLFTEMQRQEQKANSTMRQLDELRLMYKKTAPESRQTIATQITLLEKEYTSALLSAKELKKQVLRITNL